MTAADVVNVVTEVERRWRERTPATRVDEVNASYRVGRGEIRSWCSANGITLDETDEGLEVELLKLFARLRREFPDEMWDFPNARTKEMCRKYGIRMPRFRPRHVDRG